MSAPWLDLLRTEGRFSAKVHAALQNIPEAAIPDALRLLPHVPLAAEDEAGAAAVLWHRLTSLHPDTAFDLLCRMKYRFQLDPKHRLAGATPGASSIGDREKQSRVDSCR